MMNHLKDMVRLALGNIQIQSGNNVVLEWLTLSALKSFINSATHLGHKVWTRNSYAFNAHLPLLSDFDITLYDSDERGARSLQKIARKYQVIGEIGLYHSSIKNDLVSLANIYELSRDPILLKISGRHFQPNQAARTTFFIRQLQSDLKWLQTFPEVRMKKWRYLFKLMELDAPISLNADHLIGEIKHSSVRSHLQKFLELNATKDELFQLSKKAEWRYLFPQSYIWKTEEVSDQNYLHSLNELEQEILIEQIKWEFWGVGCHYYWLDLEIVVEYLSNLQKVTKLIRPEFPELAAMERVIQFMLQQNQARKENH